MARDEGDVMVEQAPTTEAGATMLPVRTTGAVWPVVVVGMGDAVRPRDKPAPDGRLAFMSGGILRTVNRDGVLKSDKTASVHVIEQPIGGVLELGQLYRAEGTVWVQPWENNGRMALSITVERLVAL